MDRRPRPCRAPPIVINLGIRQTPLELFQDRRRIMKEGIHPKYVETKVTCGCGNTFMTRSTVAE